MEVCSAEFMQKEGAIILNRRTCSKRMRNGGSNHPKPRTPMRHAVLVPCSQKLSSSNGWPDQNGWPTMMHLLSSNWFKGNKGVVQTIPPNQIYSPFTPDQRHRFRNKRFLNPFVAKMVSRPLVLSYAANPTRLPLPLNFIARVILQSLSGDDYFIKR